MILCGWRVFCEMDTTSATKSIRRGKKLTVPSMDWPVTAVRAGAFCPVGSTVHPPRRQNRKCEENPEAEGASECNVMAHREFQSGKAGIFLFSSPCQHLP